MNFEFQPEQEIEKKLDSHELELPRYIVGDFPNQYLIPIHQLCEIIHEFEDEELAQNFLSEYLEKFITADYIIPFEDALKKYLEKGFQKQDIAVEEKYTKYITELDSYADVLKKQILQLKENCKTMSLEEIKKFTEEIDSKIAKIYKSCLDPIKNGDTD